MSIRFTINGDLHTVHLDELPVDITLNTYIRNHAQLPGTKFMCLEGGCGACVVVIRERHPLTKEYEGWAANSCLTLLNTCNNRDIITIEGLRGKIKKYHPLQERLAHLNGTQCGYCSPGMIMSMHGLLEAKRGVVSMSQVENALDGNLCRCTGYRPILDAFKSFATDAEYEYIDICEDIEDLSLDKKCKKNGGGSCLESCKNPKIKIHEYSSGDGTWYFPSNLTEVFDAIYQAGHEEYMLVAGCTGHGVYRRKETIRHFIDVNKVNELHTDLIGKYVEIGGNVTLTDTINIFTQAAQQQGFEYCLKLAKHLKRVANTPVRNVGTIAGNLMLKYYHHEFPSDVFLLLATVGASICVIDVSRITKVLAPVDFLDFPMDKHVILKIILPQIDKNLTAIGTYKITPRAQNAHAYVNAGFLVQSSNNQIYSANICFGGIRPNFTKATATANFLLGKFGYDNPTLTLAIHILSLELNPDWVLPDASPEYRKLLACGLFYKFVLKNTPPHRKRTFFTSGGETIKRPISNGNQVFDTYEKNWPLTKPVTKLEALIQCSGEAMYANDFHKFPNQLWAAYVLAENVGYIVSEIDSTDALSMPGVVAFYSASDIPGKNSFVTVGLFAIVENEEIFCSERVKYHSQPVGMIVATTLDLAKRAAKKVKIVYEGPIKIVCGLKDALEARTRTNNQDKPLDSLEAPNVVKGRFELAGQYHFSMETQTTVCVPNDEGLSVFCSTQYIDMVQSAMSEALKIPAHKLNFKLKRLGGSFGTKISRSGNVAIACALAATKLNRPVRFVESLESTMATVGKRCSCICDYTVNIDSSGNIGQLNVQFYEDLGYTMNDSPIKEFSIPFIRNCYKHDGWNIKGEPVLTDAPSSTWCRAPGCLEGIAMSENIMEHIARRVNRDPIDVRMDNIPSDSKMKSLVPMFLTSTLYRSRKTDINKFNRENRWRKKGIAISLMRYPLKYFGPFPAMVVIYHTDGTVAITHGGVEMGQGINTKAAQVAAFILGVPLSMVVIKPTDNFTAANSFATGGSVTSDSVCAAVKGACEELLRRIQPIKDGMKNATWTEVIKKAHEKNVNLIANHLLRPEDLKGYEVWGLSCTEVEVDILTGIFQLNRVDILQDTGESLSPLIDVGQIEGGFIMGIGYWLTEKLVYDSSTGELKTNRSWNYKIPGAKDIPVDFRITLLQKSSNSGGVLRSKTTGELAICLSVSSIFALRHALDSARNDAGIKDVWYNLGAPTTPEIVLLRAGHSTVSFSL